MCWRDSAAGHPLMIADPIRDMVVLGCVWQVQVQALMKNAVVKERVIQEQLLVVGAFYDMSSGIGAPCLGATLCGKSGRPGAVDGVELADPRVPSYKRSRLLPHRRRPKHLRPVHCAARDAEAAHQAARNCSVPRLGPSDAAGHDHRWPAHRHDGSTGPG